MKKTIVLTIFIISSLYVRAEIKYTKSDSLKIMQLLNESKELDDKNNLVLFFARKFINTPYVAQTLDRYMDEHLVVNVNEVDCTTLVEYVCALVICVERNRLTFDYFCKTLADIRYIDGEVNYIKRKHYFTIWMNDNEEKGFIKNFSKPNPPYSAIQTVNVNYMTQNFTSYNMLKNNKKWLNGIDQLEQSILRKKYYYIPKYSIDNSDQYRAIIKNGDIISIITNKKGLDTTHIGIAVWHNNGLHMIHASSIKKKVIEDTILLKQYLNKNKTQIGIRTARIL